MHARADVDIMLELSGRAGQSPGQPPAACTPASTADATPARTPEVLNTSAVTFGGLPGAAPSTTNRTEPNWAASARTAARSAVPDATTTLQPRTSSVPANGAASACVAGPVTARYDTRADVALEASSMPAQTCDVTGSASPCGPV